MQHDLVVTRHRPLVDMLVERGTITTPHYCSSWAAWMELPALDRKGKIPVIGHATISDVRGRRVLGTIPLHLAYHARSVSEVDMSRANEADRKAMHGDISIERMRQIAGELRTYYTRREGNFHEGTIRYGAKPIHPTDAWPPAGTHLYPDGDGFLVAFHDGIVIARGNTEKEAVDAAVGRIDGPPWTRNLCADADILASVRRAVKTLDPSQNGRKAECLDDACKRLQDHWDATRQPNDKPSPVTLAEAQRFLKDELEHGEDLEHAVKRVLAMT